MRGVQPRYSAIHERLPVKEKMFKAAEAQMHTLSFTRTGDNQLAGMRTEARQKHGNKKTPCKIHVN